MRFPRERAFASTLCKGVRESKGACRVAMFDLDSSIERTAHHDHLAWFQTTSAQFPLDHLRIRACSEFDG